MGVVVDSSVLIGAERSRASLSETLARLRTLWGDVEVAVSVVTAYELLHGVWRARPARIRADREAYVEEVLARIPVYPVNLTVARIAARTDARLRTQGRALATADLLIAATALALDFGLATDNRRDFEAVPELRLCATN
ncbi:MAG TPA: PIN domain-containing protein [Terriglobales bacterium]|nr:PIN domain-containing protein [Terriglobales bacterium]